jgi:hypothetical protein
MKQTLAPLTAEEEALLQTQLDGAKKFVDAFSPDDAAEPLSVGALDRAFAEWLSAGATDPSQITAAINAVGAAFGQFLIQGLGLRWVMVSDANGTEAAVHGLPGKGDVLIFPQSLVAKRYEKREMYFLVRSYHSISQHIRMIAEAHGERRE